jgi:hypothetical protein
MKLLATPRLPLGLAAAAAALALGALLAPAPANAQMLSAVTCTADQDVTYSPGVTNSPQTVHVTASTDYTSCTVLNGGAITMAEDTFISIQAERSCADILGNVPFPNRPITWNTGEVSSVAGSALTAQVGSSLVVVHTGTVVSGPFTGYEYEHTTTYPGLDAIAACDSPEGLTSLNNGVMIMNLLPV